MRLDRRGSLAALAVVMLAAACAGTPEQKQTVGSDQFMGLRAVVYAVPGGGEAGAWYAKLLGGDAHEAILGNAGFTVGAVELELDPQATTRTLAIWEAADIDAAFARLLALGATPVSGIQEIGQSRLAIVRDPFGNLLGVTEAPQPQR